MPERLLPTLLITLLCWADTGSVSAQHTKPSGAAGFVEVKTADDNVFVGKLVSEDTASLVLETAAYGILNIRQATVRNIRPLADLKTVNGRYWPETVQSTRYFASQNGYGLPRGGGFYENGWIFFNQATYAFSDRFSVGLGFAPLVILDGPVPVWVTPKITFPIPKAHINLGIGGIYGHSFDPIYDYDAADFSACYGQLTVGSRDVNASIGLGIGNSNGVWSKKPVVSFSGLVRTGPKAALITDNLIYRTAYESGSFFSFGPRYFGRRIGFALALVLFVVDGDSGLLPWISLHIPFGIHH